MSQAKKESQPLKAAKKRQAKVNAYQAVFHSPEGTKVLHDLMQFGYMLNSSYSADPYRTAFNLGQQNVILKILTELNTDTSVLEMMIREITNERRSDNRNSSTNTDDERNIFKY
jgi:hypothetical protein